MVYTCTLVAWALSLSCANGFSSAVAFNTRWKTRSTSELFQTRSEDGIISGNGAYDLVVIGAGPVGVSAAIVAASPPFNKKVCLVDAPRFSGVLMDETNDKDLSLGGPTGLFSKALRDTSKKVKVTSLQGMGLRDISIWNEVVMNCVELATANSDDMLRQLQFSGVKYRQGLCTFAGKAPNGSTTMAILNEKEGGMEFLRAENVLIATGSKPFLPSSIPFDGKRIFDSDSINTLSFLPRSIGITGSGIVAVEFAKIFRNLGAEVTLIIRDNVPRNALMKIGLDIDIAATLVADLVRSGIKIERGAQVKSFDVPKNTAGRSPIKLTLEAKGGGERPAGTRTEVLCDAYLAAVGRTPNTSNLNLDAVGIEMDEYGGIAVGPNLETSASNVYAAGDVLGRPFLASTGLAQGVAAINSMFGEPLQAEECDPNADEEGNLCIDGNLGSTGAAFDPTSLAANPFAFPVGVWTSPESAYFGLSSQQAKDLGIDVKEGIALYAECLRGRVFSPNGLLKLVFERESERIVGVHICGDDACELVHYGMELVRSKRTMTDIVGQLYSAVTYHELYRIAAMAAMDEAAARKRRAAAGAALAAANRAKKAKS